MRRLRTRRLSSGTWRRRAPRHRRPRYKSRTSGSMTALTRLGATRTTPSPSRLNTSQTRRSSASSPRPTGSRSPSHSSASRSSRHRAVDHPPIPGGTWPPPHSLGPHLDGIPTPLNGVPTDGQIHNFTILAGVFLSDCPAGDHGNFTVWPGTHLEPTRWLHAHGTSVSDPDAFFAAIRKLAHETSQPMPLEVHAGDLLRALSAPAQLWATPRTQHSLRRVLSTSDPASR